MAFRREIDHIVDVVFGKDFFHRGFVADIRVDKGIPGIVLDRGQVLQVARIGELVQVQDTDVLIFLQHILHEIGADESGAAGD